MVIDNTSLLPRTYEWDLYHYTTNRRIGQSLISLHNQAFCVEINRCRYPRVIIGVAKVLFQNIKMPMMASKRTP